jgi:CheY-like chemotaxis protein
LAELLTHHGNQVTTAEDGSEAIAIPARTTPDVVLLDPRCRG